MSKTRGTCPCLASCRTLGPRSKTLISRLHRAPQGSGPTARALKDALSGSTVAGGGGTRTQAKVGPAAKVAGMSAAAALGLGSVRLRDLVACGGKEGGVAVVDVSRGLCVQTLDKVHWQAKRNPLASLFQGGDAAAAAAAATRVARAEGYAPMNAVGVAVSELLCVEGGMLTGGADGIVRYHPLAALVATATAAASPVSRSPSVNGNGSLDGRSRSGSDVRGSIDGWSRNRVLSPMPPGRSSRGGAPEPKHNDADCPVLWQTLA
ncbi:hypothetical protein V8C86DRAFT_462005 [Haematococcus lacustris]